MTGTHSESLGQAIHGCNPHVGAKAEAKKGKKQADDDIKESGSPNLNRQGRRSETI